MLKTLAVLTALAVAAPGLALAQGNSDNTPASQNANGVPFTGNDPPAGSFNGPPTLPVVLNPVPGCKVGDPDDVHNPSNGDDKRSTTGNPHCRPASP